VCHRVWLASPLTLSEVRSMLPDGTAAGLLPARLRDPLLQALPGARDVLTLTRGRCACDLAGTRLADRGADERRLRTRYRALGTPRQVVIAAMDAHRERQPARQPAPGWAAAFTGFVVEHARNAGPALYWLRFLAREEDGLGPPPHPRSVSAAELRDTPTGWLDEDRPILVLP
jgi:hypothetical protein